MGPQRDRNRRHGFSLMELLVVIGIIAVLVGLLLPAISGGREAARKAQCNNNLYQLSVALQNYVATHSVLPPGTVNPTGPIESQPPGIHMSWISQILPFIEQRSMYDLLDFSAGAYDPVNSTVSLTQIRTLLCPSRIYPRGSADPKNGVSSYAGCHHDLEAPIDVNQHGTLFLNSKVRVEEIT